MAHSRVDNYLLEDGSNYLLEDDSGFYVLEGAKIIRHGGWFIFDREPDPEIREEKKQELVELIKPKLAPAKLALVGKSPASAKRSPPGQLMTALQVATSRMTRAQQTRTERLLQQTGISMDELLILLQ